jgi:hypothetical protein
MAEAASGDEAVGSDDEVFTDWQGHEMHWSWRIVPVPGESGHQQLLYVAYRLDNAAASSEETAAAASSGSAAPLDAGIDKPAVVRLSAPRFGARAKAETRLAKFMEDGQVVAANAAARALFGSAEVSAAVPPTAFFGTDMTEFLSEVLLAKGVGETILTTVPNTGRKISCQVFSVQEDDAQQLLLICD